MDKNNNTFVCSRNLQTCLSFFNKGRFSFLKKKKSLSGSAYGSNVKTQQLIIITKIIVIIFSIFTIYYFPKPWYTLRSRALQQEFLRQLQSYKYLKVKHLLLVCFFHNRQMRPHQQILQPFLPNH